MVLLACFLLPNNIIGQSDTTQVVQPDTIAQQVAQEADGTQEKKEKKEKKKKKNSFKVYVGGNFSDISVPDDLYDTESEIGYLLGVSYKSGGFFYWELGARYNRGVYNLMPKNQNAKFNGTFGVSQVDIPVTVGINFLSATARLVGLRVFVSAVPAFVIGVSDIENSNVTKNDLNSFNFYGSGGVGLDVAFFFLEVGFQYGFTGLIQEVSGSNPGQAFVNLGFRF